MSNMEMWTPANPELIPQRPVESFISPLKVVTPKFVQDQWKRGQDDLRLENLRAEIIQSFISGDEWVSYNETTARLETEAAPGIATDDGPLRIPVNRMRPALRRQVSKLNAVPMRFSVPPTGSDNRSIDGARKAEAAVNDVARRHRWDDLREAVSWAAPKSGTMVLAIEWDPEKSETYECALSLAEVAFEPGTRDARDAYWWIKAQAVPAAELQRTYAMDNEPRADSGAQAQPLYRQMRGATHGGRHVERLTLVLTYYERPSALRPKGKMMVVVGGKVVSESDWPFPFEDHLNVAVVKVMPTDSRWTGETPFTDAVALQRLLSMAVSGAAENLRAFNNIKLVFPEGNESVIAEWDDDPLKPIALKNSSSGPPSYLSPPTLPAWPSELRREARDEIDQILGDFDVARGNTSGSVTSGSGLALLAEQGDAPLGLFAGSITKAFGYIASDWLKIQEMYAPDKEATALVYSDNGSTPAQLSWTGNSFAGETTAIVNRDSVMPRSQQASWEMAKELLSIYGPEAIPLEKFLQLAQYGEASNAIQHINPDVAKQRRRNHAMMTAPQDSIEAYPEPDPWDHLPTCITVANELRKSLEWDYAEQWRKDNVNRYIRIMEQFAAEQAAQQAALVQPDPLTGMINPMTAALATAPQANEPASPDEIFAEVPGAIAPEGGVGPTGDNPQGEFDPNIPFVTN